MTACEKAPAVVNRRGLPIESPHRATERVNSTSSLPIPAAILTVLFAVLVLANPVAAFAIATLVLVWLFRS